MNGDEMTPLERTLTTLGHKEPDRVPLFLLLTMHGAKELGMPIKEYFSKFENVVRGQEILFEKYKNDCIYSLFYGAVDFEAFGGDILYFDDGPPNSGMPMIQNIEDIGSLEAPEVASCDCLQKVLEAIGVLHERYGDRVPIPGVVISPFSLPVMQMGFEPYLNLILEDRSNFLQLMEVNKEFCIEWANSQLEAGATAIVYFDPVSSSTVISPQQARETGLPVAKETIASIKGPCASHFASGRVLPIAEDIPSTGSVGVGVSALEDLSELKDAFKGKMTLIGNLNGIAMTKWTTEQAEETVRTTVEKAAAGGGFILSDNHGEIPFQVKDEVIHAISGAVRKYGYYT